MDKKRTGVTPAMMVAALSGKGMLAGMPASIEASEKLGQIQLVRSTNMPLELDKEQFEKAGFTFGKPIDECFQEATLPQGWTREATSHSMHSDILDERGRRRASVFYKAAFYDRRANAYLTRRFRVEDHYEDKPGGDSQRLGAAIKDGDKVLKLAPYANDKDYPACQAILKVLQAEFSAERPDYLDPLAYWDEPDASNKSGEA